MKQIPTCKDGRGCEWEYDKDLCPKHNSFSSKGRPKFEYIRHTKPEGTSILWCSNYKEKPPEPK